MDIRHIIFTAGHVGADWIVERKQIKSRERVRKFGEVFTPPNIVSDMVDCVEPEISLPNARILEPSCGNGNFLVEILIRKLAQCEFDYERIRSIGSLYGVELLRDNVVECQKRLVELMPKHLQPISRVIVRRNIVQGDFLNPVGIWFLKQEYSMKQDFDYSEMVKIDTYNLDKEWEKQAGYMLQCMEALAQAKKEYDEAKESLELVSAEVDKEIRESADKKPSEKAIEGMVISDESVQDAQIALIDAKYNVNMLEAARAGLENKREALSALVKLHGMGYFAEPEADIQTRGELEEIKQESLAKKIKINKASNKPEKQAKK